MENLQYETRDKSRGKGHVCPWVVLCCKNDLIHVDVNSIVEEHLQLHSHLAGVPGNSFWE